MVNEVLKNTRELQDTIAFLSLIISKESEGRSIEVKNSKVKWQKVGILSIKEKRESL